MEFDKLYKALLHEENTAGGGDVFGPGSVTAELPGEYDPNSARYASSLFFTSRMGTKKRRKRKKRRKT